LLQPEVDLPVGLSRWWLPVVTTLGGLLSGVLVYTLSPEAEGHGTDAAISSYHQKGGAVPARTPFVKAIASAMTIGSGGVAGREGPTAQISVGLGSVLCHTFQVRGQERRILLLAAMSGGLAAIFGAPLGMAIFAVEILYSEMGFESEALIYTVISAVTAYALHGFVAGWSPILAIPEGLGFTEPLSLLGFGVLGIVAGLVGSLLPTLFYSVRDLFRKLPGPPHLKPALGGLGVGLLGVAIPEILGTGYGWVELALAGQLSIGLLLTLLVLKGPAMALTIGSGGSGGVFGPTVVIGAMLGGVIGTGIHTAFPALEVSTAAFVVAGMAALFSASARTPLSTLIMVAEMTGGYALIVPVMLTNVLAFLVQRSTTRGWKYPTLFQSQVAAREDSPAHRGVFIRRAMEMVDAGLVKGPDLTLPRLVSLLSSDQPVPVTQDGGLLVGVIIAGGSDLAETTVEAGFGGIEGATAITVLRGREMIIPRGPTLLKEGDHLMAVVTASAHLKLKSMASSPERSSSPKAEEGLP